MNSLIDTKFKKAPALFLLAIILLAGWFILAPKIVWGQGDEPARLELTGIDTTALPVLRLRLVGAKANGQALDYAQTPLEIQHGAETIPQEAFVSMETEDVGTFTLVLVDIPGGVAGELETIKEAIRLYADGTETGYMREPNDHLGIYAVDFADPKVLLEPTIFRNGVINWLAEDLPISNGPTALYDSLDSLLGQVDGLKPSAEMVASIIVLTDGTDTVSTRTDQVAVIQKAVDNNIAVHTVHLNNVSIFNPEEGQNFLRDLSNRTGGFATELNQEGVVQLWETVSSFSQQTIVRYRPTDPTPGNVPISVRLRDFPQIEAFTSAQFPADQLQVDLQLDESMTNIVMPDLAQPIEISIPVEVTWLDGRERAISTAQALKDGEMAAEIPVGEGGFTTADMTLTGLSYGPNEIVLTVMDENGNRGNSAPFTLNVAPGDSLLVPDNISGESGGFGRTWIFGLIGLLVLGGIIAYWLLFTGAGGKKINLSDLFKSAFTTKPRRSRRSGNDEFESFDRVAPSSYGSAGAPGSGRLASSADETVMSVQASSTQQGTYLLEVIDADGTGPESIPVVGLEQRIGRSPSKADISFEKEQTVSRIHATLAREANGYRLYDEQSTAGTYVNGQRLPEYGMMLNDGDEIQMGALVLRFSRLD